MSLIIISEKLDWEMNINILVNESEKLALFNDTSNSTHPKILGVRLRSETDNGMNEPEIHCTGNETFEI